MPESSFVPIEGCSCEVCTRDSTGPMLPPAPTPAQQADRAARQLYGTYRDILSRPFIEMPTSTQRSSGINFWVNAETPSVATPIPPEPSPEPPHKCESCDNWTTQQGSCLPCRASAAPEPGARLTAADMNAAILAMRRYNEHAG